MNERNPLDLYETPKWMTDYLLKEWLLAKWGRNLTRENKEGRLYTVFEPCSGTGSIATVLEEFGFWLVQRNDINPAMPGIYSAKDTAKEETWKELFPEPRFQLDYVISNPPYSTSEDCFKIITHARRYARFGMAMLLRISWLEPTMLRSDWLVANPPDTVLVLPRWSFKQNGATDSVTCAWMIWDSLFRRGVKVAPR